MRHHHTHHTHVHIQERTTSTEDSVRMYQEMLDRARREVVGSFQVALFGVTLEAAVIQPDRNRGIWAVHAKFVIGDTPYYLEVSARVDELRDAAADRQIAHLRDLTVAESFAPFIAQKIAEEILTQYQYQQGQISRFVEEAQLKNRRDGYMEIER